MIKWIKEHKIEILLGLMMLGIGVAVYWVGGFHQCIFEGNCPPVTNMTNGIDLPPGPVVGP